MGSNLASEGSFDPLHSAKFHPFGATCPQKNPKPPLSKFNTGACASRNAAGKNVKRQIAGNRLQDGIRSMEVVSAQLSTGT